MKISEVILREGYELRLERDKRANMLVLHVKDTRTGRRSEVRGKLGYETDGYDPNDKLHQLLDKVGRSASVSDMMNGDVVHINPRHPQGPSATKAASAVTAETILEKLGEIAPNTEIYVDMDGVLADFFGEWAKAMGKKSFRDIEDPEAAIGKIKDIKDFWLNLPVLPQAKQLLTLIKKVKGKYKICTSPLADDPRSEPHKREWVKKNLAFFPPEEVIVTHNKPKWATQKDGTPNILIDDYGVNINNWEAAGGIGFKYKDHKFDRTAKDIKQHMQEPVEENFKESITTIDLKNALEKISKNATNGERLVDVFIMRYQHNMTFKQIGDEIGTGIDRARQVYLRAERMIRKSLQDYDPKVKENFADGKKKGKSRPGRVKKSGASCSGSVTSLRKKAKAGGEKGRMYHWCANMKSGRKKK